MTNQKAIKEILGTAHITGPVKGDETQEIRAHYEGMLTHEQLTKLLQIGIVGIKRSGAGIRVSIKKRK
jgi:hypothetical protein